MNSVPIPNEAGGINPQEGPEGNPSVPAASGAPLIQSKFVLPFSWKPVRRHSPNQPFHPIAAGEGAWHPVPAPKLPRIGQRRKYFTDETSDVMFKRARWFVAKPDPAETDSVQLRYQLHCKDSGTIEVTESAELVLFEYPNDICAAALADDSDPDILLTGLLIRTVTFPDRTPLTRVLQVNEMIRYMNERWNHGTDRHWTRDSYPKFMPQKPLVGEPERSWEATKVQSQTICSDGFLIHWASWLELPVAAGTHSEHCACISPYANSLVSHQFAPDVWSFNLMPESWLSNARMRVDGRGDAGPDWMCYADDRAFTWTHYTADAGSWSAQMGTWPSQVKDDREAAWIRLLNVDKELGDSAPSLFEREWARGLTYSRWLHSGTLYGFTPHSGALLVTDYKEFPVHQHFTHEYLDQALLLLYVRTTLLRFSRKLSVLSSRRRDSRAPQNKADADLCARFTELRRDLMLFTNLYRFPQLSNQQQSLEMYKLMIKASEIDELYKEVETEARSSEEFLGGLSQAEETSKTTRLTILASIGLCFTLVLEGWGDDGMKVFVSVLFVVLLLFLVPRCQHWLDRSLFSPRPKSTRHRR